MKFFVDANLPFKLAINLRKKGYDALLTDDLPNKEGTSYNKIRAFSIEQVFRDQKGNSKLLFCNHPRVEDTKAH